MIRYALFMSCIAALAIPAHAEDAKPLSLEDLAAISGGAAPQVTVASRQAVDALSAGNNVSADQVVSGGVSFSQGAFTNFNGIGNVVVNTGNNNAIQGTLSVTVVGLPQ
jgi:hypothetical protein